MTKRFLVYFWVTPCCQFVKIGHCQGNLFERRNGINNGCPQGICEYPIGVIVCEDKADMRKVERTTQKQFKAYRTNGEWFELTDEISEYIQEFTDTESGKRFIEEDRERKNKRQREYDRERYQNDAEVRERYQNDSEHRERQQKRQRERYQNDSEFREHQKKYQREYRARKKRENQPINGQQLGLF